MKNTYFLPLLAVAAFYTSPATARNHDPENRVEFVKTSNDSVVYSILEKDRSKNVNDLPVPHFAIHTLNNKFVMTIGAKVNPIIGCDLGNNLYKQPDAGINFIPSQIPVPSTRDHRSDFFINALNADVDLQVVGFGGTDNQITGYIKFSTSGNDKAIELSKAYLSWRGLTAGLKHSLFCDEAVVPPTIDPQGPNGLLLTTVNEFGYVSPSWSGFRFGVALDMPTYYSSTGHYWGEDYKTYQGRIIEGEQVADPTAYSFKAPDVPLFVEWGASPLNRVRLSGIVRPMLYKNLLKGEQKACVGWGLSLSGNAKPCDEVTLYAQALYGKGIGAYIQDLAGMPLSFVPKDSDPGYMTPTPMMGWTFGVTYDINPKWQVNAMASQARLWDVCSYAEHQADPHTGVNDYQTAYYAAANVFYNVSSYFQLGLEYVYGKRFTWNHGSDGDSRLQFQVQFTL